MTSEDYSLGLVVLLPGKDEQAVIDGLLRHRRPSVGIRDVTWKTLVHPRRDPGCLLEARELLESFVRQASHALVLFDHQGCGQEQKDIGQIEGELTHRLSGAGWGDRAAVVVIEPELECWVWSDSPEVDVSLGWAGRQPPLRKWLVAKGSWAEGDPKPADPKRALEQALREARIPRSSAIYGELARKVGLRHCQDPAFARLTATLRSWFGQAGAAD